MSPEELYAPIGRRGPRHDPGDETAERGVTNLDLVVNNPPHYKTPNGLEAIQVIEAFARGNYHRGCALKYLLRAGKKGDKATDLLKAKWYIEREIANG